LQRFSWPPGGHVGTPRFIPQFAISATAPVRLRRLAVRDREEQPTFIPPMLLTSGAVPDGEAWALELKWDGCRAQVRYDGRSVSLRTRHGRECSADFPELKEIASVLGRRRVTLDGELVCLRSEVFLATTFGAGVLFAPPASHSKPNPTTAAASVAARQGHSRASTQSLKSTSYRPVSLHREAFAPGMHPRLLIAQDKRRARAQASRRPADSRNTGALAAPGMGEQHGLGKRRWTAVQRCAAACPGLDFATAGGYLSTTALEEECIYRLR
jgi:hypothetical protein